MKSLFNYILFFGILISCKPAINSHALSGKWIYTKVEFINQNPKIVQEKEELKDAAAYILFSKNGQAEIVSSGKIISKGNFAVDDDIIRYEEVLEDGQKRAIPFLVKELNDSVLVFETMERDVKRITAEKSK